VISFLQSAISLEILFSRKLLRHSSTQANVLHTLTSRAKRYPIASDKKI
jgi:hypothetical protein